MMRFGLQNVREMRYTRPNNDERTVVRMMRGMLPDSAVVGTYKRARRTRRTRMTAEPTGVAFLFGVVMLAYLLITR